MEGAPRPPGPLAEQIPDGLDTLLVDVARREVLDPPRPEHEAGGQFEVLGQRTRPPEPVGMAGDRHPVESTGADELNVRTLILLTSGQGGVLG